MVSYWSLTKIWLGGPSFEGVEPHDDDLTSTHFGLVRLITQGVLANSLVSHPSSLIVYPHWSIRSTDNVLGRMG